MFSHERLDVYRKALEFIEWLAPLLSRLAEAPTPTGELRSQLDRASLSILLNIAEGNGKRKPALRARFFDDARGSGTECAACLDAAVAKGLCNPSEVRPGKSHLDRIVAMLTKLIALNDSVSAPPKSPS
ncbi:four helix bundle protein [Haloferula sp. A504]|uniref:four helix bundle protein n=1 Tax=Haloferula sp. A504 TaxID=3373601 RepID=UPI0031C79980|nr:four helix bundle protein [Verrucomicrobiaceae bacterium E54]